MEKTSNLGSSNCWKCTEIVNLTITVLFLYNFKYFTIPSGGLFGSGEGGGGGRLCTYICRKPERGQKVYRNLRLLRSVSTLKSNF